VRDLDVSSVRVKDAGALARHPGLVELDLSGRSSRRFTLNFLTAHPHLLSLGIGGLGFVPRGIERIAMLSDLEWFSAGQGFPTLSFLVPLPKLCTVVLWLAANHDMDSLGRVPSLEEVRPGDQTRPRSQCPHPADLLTVILPGVRTIVLHREPRLLSVPPLPGACAPVVAGSRLVDHAQDPAGDHTRAETRPREDDVREQQQGKNKGQATAIAADPLHNKRVSAAMVLMGTMGALLVVRTTAWGTVHARGVKTAAHLVCGLAVVLRWSLLQP
jgi:hypothetical protein